MVVGSLIFVLGIDLVKEALWDNRHRVTRSVSLFSGRTGSEENILQFRIHHYCQHNGLHDRLGLRYWSFVWHHRVL